MGTARAITPRRGGLLGTKRCDNIPYVICEVENIASFEAVRDAEQAETVCPLATPSATGFEQLSRIIIPREQRRVFARFAFVDFDPIRSVSTVLQTTSRRKQEGPACVKFLGST